MDRGADAASMTTQPPLYLSREAMRLGSDRELRHRRASGALTRLAVGAYVDTGEFLALDSDERYRLRVRAASLRSDPGAQFSHDSAAVMLHLPSIGPWPQVAHQVVQKTGGGTSRVGIQRHSIGTDPAAVPVDGIVVTSLARTVADIAATTPFVRAVAMADRALRLGATPESIRAAAASRDTDRGKARAEAVIDFADGLSESPGESFARVQFRALGYPAPQLQVEFNDLDGFIGAVDFFWPDLDLIVEFDGRSKYGAERLYQRDLSLEEVLLAEKAREDRLRRCVRSFARIDWGRTSDRRALADYLRPHGLVERGRGRKLV